MAAGEVGSVPTDPGPVERIGAPGWPRAPGRRERGVPRRRAPAAPAAVPAAPPAAGGTDPGRRLDVRL